MTTDARRYKRRLSNVMQAPWTATRSKKTKALPDTTLTKLATRKRRLSAELAWFIVAASGNRTPETALIMNANRPMNRIRLVTLERKRVLSVRGNGTRFR